MPLFTAAMVMIFGGLTLYLKNETFLKVKLTVIYGFFGVVLLGGLAGGRLFIKYVFAQAFDLTEAGWKKLTLRWGIFCLMLAALNEAVSSTALTSVSSSSTVMVLATGTIHSGTITTDTNTTTKDPAAGILAGYNPGNADTVDANIHGNVVVDDFATILAPSGTDGIRAINYGTVAPDGSGGGTITVNAPAAADNAPYVQSLNLNGAAWNNAYLTPAFATGGLPLTDPLSRAPPPL